MLGTRENIRLVNPDSVIVLLIVFFGLLIYSNSVRNTTELKNKPVSTFVYVGENSAVSAQCIRVQIFQKISISNKDNFNILAFNRNPLYENKLASSKAIRLQTLRRSSHQIPQFILCFHLFPTESDEPPHLS